MKYTSRLHRLFQAKSLTKSGKHTWAVFEFHRPTNHGPVKKSWFQSVFKTIRIHVEKQGPRYSGDCYNHFTVRVLIRESYEKIVDEMQAYRDWSATRPIFAKRAFVIIGTTVQILDDDQAPQHPYGITVQLRPNPGAKLPQPFLVGFDKLPMFRSRLRLVRQLDQSRPMQTINQWTQVHRTSVHWPIPRQWFQQYDLVLPGASWHTRRSIPSNGVDQMTIESLDPSHFFGKIKAN